MACGTLQAQAQTLTPDMLRPVPGGFVSPQDLPLRKLAVDDDGSDATADDRLRNNRRGNPEAPAPSRIGQIPQYGLPPASGASDTGFNSLNRTKKKPVIYPGQAKPKPAPGPGSPAPKPAPINRAGYLRLSVPPSETANKPPIPPAMADTVPGQPPRARLKVDDDPFGAVGDYAGSFLIKSAVEVSGGYDTNPGRTNEPHGLPFWVVAPEFLAVSDWERHALVADLRGSFTGYGNSLPPTIGGAISSSPTDVSRPNFVGHVDGRIDVSRDTQITSQVRLLVSTDNPGSPNVQAGLARYPIYTTLGGTFGLDQNFNRLNVAVGGTVDRTVYQNSTLTDGETSTNDDRNFNQYGGIGRVSYELTPAIKPFVEVEGDSRVHDLAVDRSGFARDSDGGYAKAGTTFEFTRLLTGDISVGWTTRDYVDPRLDRLAGPADLGLADLDRDAADHGEILFRHPDRRDHAARHLGRADPYLHRRGRSRFPPLADRDRQIHLRHARLPGRQPQRQGLHGRGRSHLQDDPQPLDQGHAAPRHPQFQRRRRELGLDAGDARGEVAELRAD